MLHNAIIIGLTLLVVACVIILFRIRPDDTPKLNLPDDLRNTDRTHFYEAIAPNRGLPPVPAPRPKPKHAEEPKTEEVYYGPMNNQHSTRMIPRIR